MNVMKSEFLPKQKRIKEQRQRNCLPRYYTVSNMASSLNYFNMPARNNRNDNLYRFLVDVSRHDESDVQENDTDTYTLETFNEKLAINQSDEEEKDRKGSAGSTSVEFKKLLQPFGHFQEDSSSPEISQHHVELLYKSDETSTNVIHEHVFHGIFKKPTTKYSRINEGAGTSNEFLPHDTTSFSTDSIYQSILNVKARKSIKQLQHPSGPDVIHQILQTPDLNKIQSLISNSGRRTPKTRIRKGKSPKFSTSNKLTVSEAEAYILGLTEGRGQARGEVGIAAMDPKRPHLILCQISDNQRYVHSLTKINVFEFVEVIVPNTFVEGPSPSKLYNDIRSRFPNVTLTSVQRRHFNETIGLDMIKQYCSPESVPVMTLLRDKFYALSAAAALLKYIEFTQNVRLAPRSLRIEYQGTQDTMVIDLDTANVLELLVCTVHPQTNMNNSLLGVVRHCHTKGGVRLLKANILQPPCSLNKIQARLDCVSELVNNPLLLCSLEAAVTSFTNLESLLNLCMHAPLQEGLQVAEYQLKYTLLLKTMLELLPTLSASLEETKSKFFCDVRENLEDVRYAMILNRILETIFENAKAVKGTVAAHLHGCFAIKPGINGLLDIAKKTYCEIVQEISDHITKLQETYNLPLRISFSANKGFHIQYTPPPGQKTAADLPKEFILVQKSKATYTCYTVELVALDQRSQHVLNEIKLMTNVVLFDLLTDVREHIGCLFNLSEHIAEMDVIVSFAHVGSGTNYVRPRFGDELNLVESRHPVLDVVHDAQIVPNDALANSEQNFIIITGPNQSGKSIYARQVALLQIMAQIGCYVPAKEATFRITDHIFSRITFDDNIESSASTLMIEMRDFEYINSYMTPNSLVIIDELCRGTSVEEGTCLAFTLCEQLLDSSAFVFFTTHYLFLTKLEHLYSNVKNYHFETKMEITQPGKPVIQFTHIRKPGPTTADMYGIQIAESTSFPKDVISKAREFADKLVRETKTEQRVSSILASYRLSQEFHWEMEKCGRGSERIMEFKEKYWNVVKDRESEELITETGTGKGTIRQSQVKRNENLTVKLANKIKKKYTKLIHMKGEEVEHHPIKQWLQLSYFLCAKYLATQNVLITNEVNESDDN